MYTDENVGASENTERERLERLVDEIENGHGGGRQAKTLGGDHNEEHDQEDDEFGVAVTRALIRVGHHRERVVDVEAVIFRRFNTIAFVIALVSSKIKYRLGFKFQMAGLTSFLVFYYQDWIFSKIFLLFSFDFTLRIKCLKFPCS